MFYNSQNFKRKAFTALVLSIFVLGIFPQIPGLQNNFLASKGDGGTFSKENQPQSSETDHYTTDWIKYGNFSTGADTYWGSKITGDSSDINMKISNGEANYEVVGDKFTKEISGPITTTNWKAFNKTTPALNPDGYGIDSNGFYASHSWHDNDAKQFVSITWRYNVSMGMDMSAYTITDAFIDAIMNATVDQNVDTPVDTECRPGQSLNQPGIYDHALFYVEIADVQLSTIYRVLYNKTNDLGQLSSGYPTILSYSDKSIEQLGDEQDLIYYLTSVLSKDAGHDEFVIIAGIDIQCEDNSNQQDYDDWTSLRINSFNLTFSYENNIDQLTTASWNQGADQGLSKIPSTYEIENATLNFKYKTDLDWSTYTSSPNSEFQILINNNLLGETVKLSTATTTYKDITVGGFDVKSFITPDNYVNISIQIYIGDNFGLDTNVTISIDNVSLIIGYGIVTPPDSSTYDLILNGVDRTTEKSTQITFNDNLSIAFVYKNSTEDFIPGADVGLTGAGLNPITLIQNDSVNYYTAINSSDLGVGITYLTLTASKRYHTTVQFQITIEVVNRDTELQLYLDKSNQTIYKEWTTAWNENLNITIKYLDIDNTPSTHISGATVELTGVGGTKYLIEDSGNEQYEISINTFDIGVGSTYLTVYAFKDNYTSLNIRFKITVTNRAANLFNLELNGTSSADNSIDVQWNEVFDITVSYNDTTTYDFIQGATLELIGTGYSKGFSEESSVYRLSVDTFDLSIGNNFLTLLAQKNNYSIASKLITITVKERGTTIESILNHTSATTINYPHGEMLNITAIYNDKSGPFIDGATVQLREGSTAVYNLTESSSPDQYSIEINTDELNLGVNLLTLYAKKENYTAAFVSLTIIVDERDVSLDILLDSNLGTVIDAIYNENVNITAIYRDFKNFIISGATVELINGENVYPMAENVSNHQYTIFINTTNLNLGTNLLAIRASKENYTSIVVGITINVLERNTNYTIYLDGIDYTAHPAISAYPNQLINLTISYIDLITTQFISGATVDVNGSGISEVLGESHNNYTVILDASNLNSGFNFLTIYARKEGYDAQSITLAIQIVQVDTVLNLYLDGVDRTLNPSIDAYTNQYVNLTVSYQEQISSLFISGATVDVNGSGVSEVLAESYNNYTVLIDTSELSFGANFLTIYARKQGYESQSIIITVQIIQIETVLDLYLNGVNKTLNPAMTAYTDQFINLTVSYREQISSLFISGATVDVNGSSVSEVLGESFNNYTVMINTNQLNFGANFLTVYARKAGYQPRSIIITIQIVQIETVLNAYLNGVDKTLNPAITAYANQFINLTVSYREQISSLFISGATVDVNGSGVSEVLVESYNNYTVMIDTSQLNFGANFLTIYARKEGYEPQSIIITFQIVQIESVLDLYLNGVDKTLNPAVTTYTDLFINLTVSYREQISSLFISGATVDVNGSGVSEVLGESYNNYTVMIDTSQLNFGANFLTVYARKGGYEPQSIIITIQIVQIESVLDLYLNGVDKTLNPAITAYNNQFINLTVSYTEDISALFISGATVDVNGSGISEVLGESYNNYTVMIDTSKLNFGANFLTVYARKEGYEPQSIIITVQIVQIETVLDLYLNGVDKTSNPVLTTYTDRLINLTVSYTEDISSLFISGATVDVNGSGISEVLGESYNNYTVMINTTDLNFGANFLTVYARKAGYEPQSIIFTIQIVQIETVLNLYLNGIDKTLNPALTTYTDQFINLTVSYTEDISALFISGATVDVNGSGISEVLGESYNNYTVMIDTSKLNFGANFLTVYARKVGYEPQSIIITVQIVQIETVLDLYLNGVDKTSNPALTTYTDQLINITVSYKELISSLFISGATVDVNGTDVSGVSEVLAESHNNYTVVINTNQLRLGANFLTIFARKEGYEPQSIIITVQIIQIETGVNVTLNGNPSTFLTIPIRKYLNITVNYFEIASKTAITGATVQVLGGDYPLILTEDSINHQYSIVINTNQLDLGGKLLTVYCNRTNYQPYSANLKIQVDRIRTNITTYTGDTLFNFKPGDNFRLKVILTDLDFNTSVLNATVTYTWDYGQGYLTDENNDGIYEGTILNLREGTFVVTISVYAGDDYEFDRFTVTLNVVRPPEEVLLFQILTIVGVGAAVGLGGYLLAYQRVLKYPKQVRKIRKYKSKLKKRKSLGIESRSRDQIIEDSYADKIKPLEKTLKTKMGIKAEITSESIEDLENK